MAPGQTQKNLFRLQFFINFLLYSYNMRVVPLFLKLECRLKMSSTYGRKQKGAAMAACRWANLEKVTVQVGSRNLKDAQTETEIGIALLSPANSLSAAFLTAPKLPERLLR